jgi:hypothetical protein
VNHDEWLRAGYGQASIRHVGPVEATERGRIDVASVIYIDVICECENSFLGVVILSVKLLLGVKSRKSN